MYRAVPLVLPAPIALKNRHPVRERTRREHPQRAFNTPFLTYEDHRRSRTVCDWLYEAGLYPADVMLDDGPAWVMRTVLAMKYDSFFKEVMCVVDWGPKFDMYRYQWVCICGLEEDARQTVFDNIMDEDTLVQYVDKEFWASPYAECNIREIFR